jgi:NADH dehydrogenase FAD-containing subunit
VLEALARGEFPPTRVTLISPAEEYFYSGMKFGITGGQYEPEQARFRPPLLARAAGAEWVCAAVVRVDAVENRVALSNGTEIAYHLLSLNVGARLQGDDLPGVSTYPCPVAGA